MGNTDSIPIVSQAKSLTQYIGGDSAGALATQQNFAYNNTFPIISQIASAGYAIGGDPARARDLQERFGDEMLNNVLNSIPVAGHIKGAVHFALGENKEGEEAMKAASRSTGVLIGGIGGFAAGGPVGAVAGGIAGGAAADGIITGSDIIAKGDAAQPYGYVAAGEEIVQAVKGKKKISTEQGFDMAMVPISDGMGGYAGGEIIGKPIGLDVAGSKVVVSSAVKGGAEKIIPVLDDAAIKAGKVGGGGSAGGSGGIGNSIIKQAIYPAENEILKPNKWGFDKSTLDNRANQLNPNHKISGPGRPAGYPGSGTQADLNNHANQLNPNSPTYQVSRGSSIDAPVPPANAG